MQLKNSSLANISAIDNMIIFCFNEEEKVYETIANDKYCKTNSYDKTLLELFGNDAYVNLLHLISRKINSISIIWQNLHFEVTIDKVPDSTSEILYLFDITKYSSVESKLKKSMFELMTKKEELEAVFDLAANGISILDCKGMFLYSNNFFQKMMGYTMEELLKESCISLSSSEYKNASQTAVDKVIKEGKVENFRKVCVTKGGEHINAGMSLSYLKSRNEIVMITSDITDDIRYQEELKTQVEIEVQKQTKQHEIMCHQSRLAAMGEMIDSIAHQWRQPLNGLGLIVQGLRHLSKKDELNHEMLEEVEVEIMEKVNYMSQTIDDFSTFFRLSKQKEYFNLLKNINDAIRLIDVQLKINKIKVNVVENKKNIFEAFGFPNEFRQVIMNIVHNAMSAIIQTSQKEGEITLKINYDKSFIQVIISDNGGGIKKKDLPKIFDPYFTTKENGSGIGLYMSKVIIEHHMQGQLSVKNYKNGTQFILIINKKEL